MADLELLPARVAQAFERIEHDLMAGIPLLNPALRVQALGFQAYQGRCLGVVITPWMMNLLLFARAGDDWADLEVGAKRLHKLPSDTYEFVVNDIPGLGVCQSHSLYSPMNDFHSQHQAVVAAEKRLETLMTPVEQPAVDPEDEALLHRILRGEEPQPAEPDDSALRERRTAMGEVGPSAARRLEQHPAAPITRRDLLRGNLRRNR